MRTTIIDHPIASDRLTTLRDRTTTRPDFRRALHELSWCVLYEALRDHPTVTVDIDTPLAPMTSIRLAEAPIVVPVMRAGLGMLDAALDLLPEARVGFVGLKRDEETLESHAYVNTVPDDLSRRSVVVLDPMLATGGSLLRAVDLIAASNPGPITVASVLAAPEGIARVEESGIDMSVWTAAVDDRLNDVAFIHPGLGDAGDRQFGLA